MKLRDFHSIKPNQKVSIVINLKKQSRAVTPYYVKCQLYLGNADTNDISALSRFYIIRMTSVAVMSRDTVGEEAAC